jgi:hypothetical protein
MKTIRAGEAADQEWSGMLNEAKFEREAPKMAVNSLWFSSKKFSGEEAVQRWCEERGMDSKNIERTEGSYKIVVGKTVADTERAVWASPGVVALVGIEKIDTGALAGGGSLNPLQQGAGDDKAGKKDEETKTETVAEKELSAIEKTFAKFEADLSKALA